MMSTQRVGILGAGQLALMLTEAASKLKISCAQYSGSIEDEKNLTEFFSNTDVILFESDFLPYEKLKAMGAKVFVPELSLMRRLSDKIEQKKILQKLGIPTAPFNVKTGDASAWIDECLKSFSGGAVFKWARGGYDGKGVHLYNGDRKSLLDFINAAESRSTEVFCEAKIPFAREISQISAYSKTSEWAFYPLVISQQEKGICRFVKGPAEKFGVNSNLSAQIKSAAKKLGEHLGLFGVFAIEMFETKTGEFVVNEIAPRVHNTGHFSLNASKTSQFENHLRACLGMPLGSCESDETFGMFNLLGDHQARALPPSALAELGCDESLKWYGKEELRAGRKMGHLNFWNFDKNSWDAISKKLVAWEAKWLIGLNP